MYRGPLAGLVVVLTAVLLFASSEHPIRAAAAVVCVDASATGANNGGCWANAFVDLQDAIGAAQAGDEIWVAGGTYRPSTGGDRNARFNVKPGTALYGGFRGDETERTERDFAVNQTVLSGDLGTPGDLSDNSMSVVGITDGDISTVVDGFVIMGGNGAFGGTGLDVSSGQATVANLVFTGNGPAAGVMRVDSSPDPTLATNLTFLGNGDTRQLYVDTADLVLSNATFEASHSPAIDVFDDADLLAINVSVAGSGGGLSARTNARVELQNVISWTTARAEVTATDGSTVTIVASVIEGGCPAGAICDGVIDEDPLLGPVVAYDDGVPVIPVGAGSPAIDAGSNADCPSADARGLARPRAGSAGGPLQCDIGSFEFRPVANLCLGFEPSIIGMPSGETLRGTTIADLMYAGGGADTVLGLGGDDFICGGGGDDRLYGGAGDDSLFGEPGADILVGTAGDDTIDGGGGEDTLLGASGEDNLDGGPADDSLSGGGGVDHADGGPGSDSITGGSGADVLDGGRGNDDVHGNAAGDVLDGGGGADDVRGYAGADILDGGPGKPDACDGGAGNDVLANDSGCESTRSIP